MRTYRRSATPIKEVKRILLEHYGSENYINEMSETEMRRRADTIQMNEVYKEIIESMRKQNG